MKGLGFAAAGVGVWLCQDLEAYAVMSSSLVPCCDCSRRQGLEQQKRDAKAEDD